MIENTGRGGVMAVSFFAGWIMGVGAMLLSMVIVYPNGEPATPAPCEFDHSPPDAFTYDPDGIALEPGSFRFHPPYRSGGATEAIGRVQ